MSAQSARSNETCANKVARNSRVQEAKLVFGSDDDTHPGVKHLFSVAQDFYVGGKLEAISRLEHYDFLDLRCKLKPFHVPVWQ